MSGCIFCEILNGRAPASMIYRDEQVAAFMDILPINPGHLLVVPLRHAGGLTDLDDDSAAAMMRLGKKLAVALRAGSVRCEGVNLLIADGEAAGQEVFHVHLHVTPRYAGDGFGFRRGPANRLSASRAELDRLAAEIQSIAFS